MDLQYLKKLIRLVEQSGIDELELDEEGTRIRIARHQKLPEYAQHQAPLQIAAAPAVPARVEPAVPELKAPPKEPEKKYHEVKSPIVGTFYRAPAPDADPYVEVGGTIQHGSVLCIIEAMKLMNEIESDMAGRVVKIIVENAQPVEYNQTLFLIEPL
jgi:acetyl-CoA carboxylase biotin carboxyl carrier protein